ncbi:MAG: hypothetical protein ACRDP4_13195 [Nocardioidaceae bacterium]
MIDDHPYAQTRSDAMGRTVATCCSWLVCSPPTLPADTPAKRLADRVMPRSGWPSVVYFAAVLVLLGVAPLLPTRPELAVTALASIGGGAWCAINFWRCRHAHCVVTGAGWLALGSLSLVGAGVGHSVLAGAEQVVFYAVLVVGVIFEAGAYLSRGSVALRPVECMGDPGDARRGPANDSTISSLNGSEPQRSSGFE